MQVYTSINDRLGLTMIEIKRFSGNYKNDKTMRKFILIILIPIFCLTMFGQPTKDNTKTKAESKDFHLTLDTLKVQTIKPTETTKPWYENNNMPWIISLIISAMTIGINIYIAKVSQTTAINNVAAQINSSTDTSKNQIEGSKQIAIQQIQNSQNLALTQFKATLNTKNRQDWINELRQSISEFLAQCAMINVIMSAKNNETHGEELLPFFEKMVYHKNKIAILLNIEKEEQKAVIEPIYEMVKVSLQPEEDYDAEVFRKKEEEILKASRHLFGVHWDKIKNI